MLATHRSLSLPRNPPSSFPSPPSSATMAFKPSHAPRRPSLTSPMSWLTRTPSQASQATLYAAAAKPMRISEPTLEDAPPRVRELGTGALVVRTPDDALAGSGVRVLHASDDADKESTCIMESENEDEEEEEDDAFLEQCEHETEQRHPATPSRDPAPAAPSAV
ncbi:hypothetical protein EVG20_g3483 [Dentipellis fragilis]|uniref:Uncharacterized protein n=1 Tax=Dentipellis fragilis TaxID=205917 RepID=A0A4Y9Z443_9AGAM|nr:hypothetical protein EVG20_g3483 [Dentipellis fragilis]